MNIKITNLPDAIEAIAFQKTDLDIISIRGTDMPKAMYEDFDIFNDNYNSIIVEVFDDIITPQDGYKLVTKSQVWNILNWSEDKSNILVHCTAGICRSSAIAYLLLCKYQNPDSAIQALKSMGGYYYPNIKVVEHGSKILKNPQILSNMLDFHKSLHVWI